MINWSTSDIAGIEFGDTHVAVARLREKASGSFLVTHAGWENYEPAAPLMAKAGVIKQLWKRIRMPTRTVCAALRSSSMVVRSFSVPAMTEEELKGVLSLQAEEALQLSRQEIVVEWIVNHTANAPDESVKGITGIYAAAPVKDVEEQLELLHAADLDPVILDIRALAVANLRAALKGADAADYPLCLVNLSPHAADIILQQKPGVIYPHTVYCRASTWDDTPEFLVENIRDVLRYGEYKLGWTPINRVVLAGQVREGSVLQTKVCEALNLEVQLWEPWEECLELSRSVKRLLSRDCIGDGGILVPAFGLGLRSV